MKNLFIISCLFFIICTKANAQSVNTSYLCLSNGDIVLADFSNCSSTVVASYSISLFDIAEGDTNNTLYGIRDNIMYTINTTTGIVNSLGALSPIGYSGPLLINSLVKESPGVLLGVNDDFPGELFRINVANMTATNLGDTGYGSAGDLTYFEGELYLSANQNRLVKVDVNIPSNSILIGTISGASGLSNVFGVVTIITQNPCSISPTYELIATGGNDTAILDETTAQSSLNCSNIVSSSIYGASEVASDIICSINLDLEENGTSNTAPIYCDVAITQLNAIPDPINPIGTYSYQWTEQGSSSIIGTNDSLPININSTTTYVCVVTDSGKIAPDNIATATITVTINQAPIQPTIECWETATFNNTSCNWDISGTQSTTPTNLECWETAIFNNTSCNWEISGSQPNQPIIECWETTAFNNTSCNWEVSGSQPTAPTNLECWEIATFNNSSCNWEITNSQPIQPITECWETTTFNITSCSWETIGTQPTQPNTECWETATFNNTSCNWEVSGSQPTAPSNLECWQIATFNENDCVWEITGTQPMDTRSVFLALCEDEMLTLNPNTSIQNASYQWSTNQQTPTIDIENPGIYTVEVTDGCYIEITNFTITFNESPIIESVVSLNGSIIVSLANQDQGQYQYSLDGIIYQNSNIFTNIPNGVYTVYARSLTCDFVVTQEHLHFFIPQYFTPNGDGVNDYFAINDLEFYGNTTVIIFNRYGKLLFSAKNRSVRWDGTLRGNNLPSSDYWYLLTINGKEFKGHFTLKR